MIAKIGHCQLSQIGASPSITLTITTDRPLSSLQTTSVYKLMAGLAYKWSYVNGCTMDSRDSSGIQPLRPPNTLTRLSDKLRHILAFSLTSSTSVSTCTHAYKLYICRCFVPSLSPLPLPRFPPVRVSSLFHSPMCRADFICTGSPFESVVVAFRVVVSVFSIAVLGESEKFRSVTLLTEIHPARVSFLYPSFSVAPFTFSPASVSCCSTSGKSAFFRV